MNGAGIMLQDMILNSAVETAFVGKKARLTIKIFVHDLGHSRLVGMLDMEGANLAAALDKRNDGPLV